MNDELIDLVFIEKRRNDARATHHPDVFPLFRPQSTRPVKPSSAVEGRK